MVIILVKWFIKKNREAEFKFEWEKMKPNNSDKLFREFFGCPKLLVEEKYHTLDLESPNYSCFINIGIWESLDAFDTAIGQHIPNPSAEENFQVFKIFNFEFKMRERLVLEIQKIRSGNMTLSDL